MINSSFDKNSSIYVIEEKSLEEKTETLRGIELNEFSFDESEKNTDNTETPNFKFKKEIGFDSNDKKRTKSLAENH